MTPKTFPIEIRTYNALCEENQRLRKALEGVQHHNRGTKRGYQLPESLMRQIRAALADTKGATQS